MIIRNRAAFGAALALFVVATTAARAQDAPAPAPSATPLVEIGRVVTSDRHEEPIDRTTRPTFVVDRTRIEARGARTVADALAGVPGVDVYRYGGFGSQASVFVHGTTSAGQVLVLLDGLPLAPASNGTVDLGELSTVGVRRIEIVEGGGSTLYGASAVGGVINVITDIPRGTYLEASSGSFGDRDLRVGAGNGRIGVSVERHLARNDYAYPAQFGQPAGVRTNADAEQTSARVAYDARIGGGIDARIRVGSSALSLGVPGRLDFLSGTARQPTSQNDARIEFAKNGARAATVLSVGASTQRLAYIDDANGPETVTNDARTQLSLRHTIVSETTTVTGGLDFARESALLTNTALYDPVTFAPTYFDITRAQSQAAAYGEVQLHARSGSRFAFGLRGEHDAPTGGVITPSVGAAVPLAPGVRIAANVNGSFRTPTIIDLAYPGFSNPNLKAERATDADVTLQSENVLGGATFGWFDRNATNLIVLDDTFVPQNVARASIAGFQGTVRTRPFHGIVGSLGVTDVYRALDLSPGRFATRLAFHPTFTSTLTLERALAPNVPVGYGVVAQIAGPHVESPAINGGWTTVDAYVRARVVPAGGIVTLRARNLGNERYAAVVGYPAPSRSFQVEFSNR